MPGYTLPDGLTLKNKLGATTTDELEKQEVDEVRERLFAVELGYGPQGSFDAEHLKALHQHLFQDVYEWAGHTRNERVALSDGTVAAEPIMQKPEGQPFAIGPAIPDGLDRIADRLKEANFLRDLPREEFAARAADVMSELNTVHPFREGNGRTQRVFMEQLAAQAGHDLDFSVVSKERMTQASIEAHEQGDPSMMRRMFDEISNPERVELLREGIEKLQDAYDRDGERLGLPPEQRQHWNDRYVASLDPAHEAELVLAGTAGKQFMARSESAIFFGRAADLPEPAPKRGQRFTYAPSIDNEQSVGQEAGASRDFQGIGNAMASGAERLLDFVADSAEGAVHSIADGFAGLLGGGPPAPERQAEPEPISDEERQQARRDAYLERQRQQHEGELRDIAHAQGLHEGTPEVDLERARDQGGISR